MHSNSLIKLQREKKSHFFKLYFRNSILLNRWFINIYKRKWYLIKVIVGLPTKVHQKSNLLYFFNMLQQVIAVLSTLSVFIPFLLKEPFTMVLWNCSHCTRIVVLVWPCLGFAIQRIPFLRQVDCIIRQ